MRERSRIRHIVRGDLDLVNCDRDLELDICERRSRIRHIVRGDLELDTL